MVGINKDEIIADCIPLLIIAISTQSTLSYGSTMTLCKNRQISNEFQSIFIAIV